MLLALALATACGESAPASPSVTPTTSQAPATATPSVAPSRTPVPTPSPSPTATVTATSTPSPSPVPAFHPDGTRTGIPAIDGLLEAVIGRHRAALDALVKYSAIPCARTDDTKGDLECEGNDPSGTQYDVFGVGKGPFLYVSNASEVGLYLDNVTAAPAHLRSVFRTSGTSLEARLFRTEFAVVFMYDESVGFTMVLDADGGLREVFTETPFSATGSSDVILPPPGS